jgi:hypothetical protein
MSKRPIRRAGFAVMFLSLVSLAVPPTAVAGIVGTDQAISLEQRGVYLDRINATLARQDVRDTMLSMGVDPAEVGMRVDALTDNELAALAQRMAQAPAGGDILVIIGVVFVVLIILEFVGVIDIFKKN